MKIKYVRISTANQNTERQLVNENDFDKVYVDVCSGSVPFAKRPEAIKLLNNEAIKYICVNEVTRLGRNLSDILKTLEYFNNKGVNIFIENLGLQTILPNGDINPTASLVISLLGSIGEYERNLINERTQQGREIAKAKKKYKGRKRGATAKIEDYKLKHQNHIKSVQNQIDRGTPITEISENIGIPRTLIYRYINKKLVTKADF